MINRLQSEHARLKNKFGIGWLAFTLMFLFGMIFFGWKHFQLQKQHLFQQHANHLAFKIDGLIEHILEAGQSLPYYKNSQGICEDELFDKLSSTVFNHTDISGVVISDSKNKVLCASPEINTTLPQPGDASPVLLGPMKMSQSSNDVFLLQQRLGQYHVGIYLIRPLIQEYMRKYSTGIDYAGLYDTSTRQMLVQTGKPINVNKLSDDESVMTLALQNLDNLSLVVSSHPMGFMKQLISTIAMMTIPFLLVSWAFYVWCTRLINRRFSLQYALSNAMKNGEFYPAYQAVRDESQQRFCGAEVLIRWHTSENEVIMPDYFVDEAEKTGLIIPMTLQLIEKSFRECQSLLQAKPYMYLAFNLSPCHFHDTQFFTTFYDLCSRFQIRPEQVMLELTERELFNEQDKAEVDKMNELRQRGYRLAIDDFGTGRSNIHYLQHFPFDYLKIDKLFISSIGTGAITETLNHSIINMARSLHLKIIAEGVETQTQLDYLRNHQVFLIQGWYYTRALPYDAFATLM